MDFEGNGAAGVFEFGELTVSDCGRLSVAAVFPEARVTDTSQRMPIGSGLDEIHGLCSDWIVTPGID